MAARLFPQSPCRDLDIIATWGATRRDIPTMLHALQNLLSYRDLFLDFGLTLDDHESNIVGGLGALREFGQG